MDTVNGNDGGGDGEAGTGLVFLYQLVEGAATCSHACHVAGLAGLPREIISRGQEVNSMARFLKLVIALC